MSFLADLFIGSIFKKTKNGIVRLQCVFLFVDSYQIIAYLFAQIIGLEIRFALVSEKQAALFYDNNNSLFKLINRDTIISPVSGRMLMEVHKEQLRILFPTA